MSMPSQKLTKEALEVYRSRWNAIAEVEAEEKRQATIAQRWQKLNAMLKLIIALGLYEKMRDANVEDVRQRWIKLKANYR